MEKSCLFKTALAGSIVTFLLTLSIFTVFIISSLYHPFQFAIGIDCGSSHTEFILYTWRMDKLNNTGLVKQVHDCHMNEIVPIVSENVTEKAETEQQYRDCLNQLFSRTAYSTSRGDVKVYLGATAGVRLLEIERPTKSYQLFKNLRKITLEEGFTPVHMNTITGFEEGKYAWITANYISNNLEHRSRWNESIGVLDQGGASAQMAKAVEIIEGVQSPARPHELSAVTLFGKTYDIYSYSNLCYGLNELIKRYMVWKAVHGAENKTIELACFPKGYVSASPNFNRKNPCLKFWEISFTAETLNKTFSGTGNHPDCVDYLRHTAFLQHYCNTTVAYCFAQNRYPTTGPFYAISSLYYARQTLGLPETTTKADFQAKAEQVCNMTLKELVAKFPGVKEERLHVLCFQSLTVLESFDNVYRIREKQWKNIKFTKKVGDNTMGWLMGFVLSETNLIPSQELNEFWFQTSHIYFYTLLGVGLLTCTCFFALIRFKSAQVEPVENNGEKGLAQPPIPNPRPFSDWREIPPRKLKSLPTKTREEGTSLALLQPANSTSSKSATTSTKTTQSKSTSKTKTFPKTKPTEPLRTSSKILPTRGAMTPSKFAPCAKTR